VMAPDGALGQKKNQQQQNDGNAAKATDQEYAALANYKQIGGKVYYVDSGAKVVTLRVDIPQYVPNPNYKPNLNQNVNRNYNPNANRNNGMHNHMQNHNNLMQQYHQAMATAHKNPAQAQMKMAQIAMQMQQMEMQMMMQMGMQMQRQEMMMMQQMMRANSNPNNQPFKVTTTQKDFDLEFQDNVAVRKMFLSTDYDDMGNPKQYTKAQLAELRGKDSSKPGYTAKFEDVQPGQEVVLYLSKASAARKSIAPAKDDKKDDDKKGDDEKKADAAKKDDAKADADAKKADKADAEVRKAAPGAEKPVVTMIVMTKEMPSALQGAAQAPAKKK
jgi:hypothetical protein